MFTVFIRTTVSYSDACYYYFSCNRWLTAYVVEIGATEAIQQHFARHVVTHKPISQRKLDFEHSRPRWLREMAAEATGVFFYV